MQMRLVKGLFCVVVITLLSTSSIANGPPPEEVIALWHFDEGVGDTVYDATESNHDGVIEGALWTTGRLGYGLSFNSNYIEVPDSPDWVTPELTVESWIYPTSISSGLNILIRKGIYAMPLHQNISWVVKIADGNIDFCVGDMDGDDFAVIARGATTLDTNTWYYLAITYDEEYARIYINGQLDENGTANPYYYNGGLDYVEGPLNMGAYDSGVVDPFFGIMDEVRISNRALTASEISDHYLAAFPQLSLVPDFQLNKCEEEDTLWIYINEEVVDLEAALLNISFDGSFVTIGDIIKGPALDPPGNFFLDYDIYPDSVSISLAVLSGSFDGPGSIIGLVYNADDETVLIDVSIDSSSLRNLDNQEIAHSTTGASIQIDCTAPTVEVISPASGGFYDPLPTLTIDLSDDVGLDRAYYQIDDCEGTWTELWSYNSESSDTTINWTVPGISEDSHTIYFKVFDDAGNPNNDTCTYSWSFTYGYPTISLIPDFQLDKCGDMDTLWLYANDYTADIKASFFRLGYDNSFITPTEVIKGPALDPPEDFVLYFNIYPDSILINLAALTGAFDGPGSMIGIILTADIETPSTFIAIDSSIQRDPENQDVPHNTEGASLQIDCTEPTVEVISPPSGGFYDPLPILTINFDDDVGLDRAYYQIDGCEGTWMELWSYNSESSDTTINWTVPGISEGSHIIYFKVFDDAGNPNGDTCTYSWSFTYGFPTISLLPNFQQNKCGDIDTLWLYANDYTVDTKASFFRLGYDDGFITPTDVIKSPDLDPPENFVLYFNIYPDSILINLAALTGAFDGPGSMIGIILTADIETPSTFIDIDSSILRDPENQDVPHNTEGASLQIDCTEPTVEVISPPSGGFYDPLPILTIDLSDNFGLDRASYQIDGCEGTWTELWSYNSASSDTTINWTVPSISEGSHTIYFKVFDDAGNPNGDTCTYSWSFTYDVTRPTVLVTAPASGSTYYSTFPILTINLSDNLDLDRAYYQIDGCEETWTELWSYNSESSDTTVTWMVPSVIEGPHFIYFKARDDAGNTSEDTCSYYWTFTYQSEFDCIPGEADGIEPINIFDITYMISYLYKSGPAPIPYERCSGDVNCDCSVNIFDITYLIIFLYNGGPAPCNGQDWLDGCGFPLKEEVK